MSARKTEIEKERARLLASKDMAQEDRDKVQRVLQNKEDELRLASEQQQRLERKLQDLNSKVSILVPISAVCVFVKTYRYSNQYEVCTLV